MAAHSGLHALTAASVTAAVLLARWAATRPAHDRPRVAAGGAPGQRAAPGTGAPDPVDSGMNQPYGLFEEPVWREADAHLEQCWDELRSLYLPLDGEHRDGRKS